MTSLKDALEHLQRCSNPEDRKWLQAWAGVIRAIEQRKGGDDIEQRVQVRWAALFPKQEIPEEEEEVA